MRCALLIVIIAISVSDFNAQYLTGRRRSCPRLRLANGRVRNKPRVFAQFICNQGFVLLGDRYSKCQDGVWDNPVPVCVRPSCKIPQELKFGVVYPSFRDAVLRFFCNPGYELHGPSFTYCNGTTWNTYLPSCVRSNTTPSISCDFEDHDICGWTHDLNHDFAWERISNNTPSRHVGTGPSYDHTKGPGPGESGFYMYIESSFKNENDIARLISPIYKKQPTTRTCLEFYYHMYGSGIGQLQTYLKLTNASWGTKRLVHRISGNQGDVWRRGFVDLELINNDFQIIFEGVRGVNYISDIAIDDVKLIEDCNIDEMTTVTTDEAVEMSTITYESCENRCFKRNETLVLHLLTVACDCDENCQERNSCCPDFSIYCIIEYTTDVTEDTTFEDTTTKSSTFSPSTQTIFYDSTTGWSLSTQGTRGITTSTQRSTMSTRRSTTSTQRSTTSTQRSTTSTQKSTTSTQRSSTTQRSPTTQRMVVPIPSTTSSFFPFFTTSFKPSSTRRFIDDVVTFPTTKTSSQYIIDPTVLILNVSNEGSKPSTSPPNNSLTVKAVIISSALVFVVLAAVFVLRRVSVVRCLKMKKMRNGNGDSQSDVRFLTSDEILDFTIATPRNRREY